MSAALSVRSAVTPVATVGCSQCGGSFGPGTEGFSHCADHAAPRDNVTIRLTVDGKTMEVSMALEGMDAKRLTGPMTFRRDEVLDHIVRFAKTHLDIELRARFKEGASAARAA